MMPVSVVDEHTPWPETSGGALLFILDAYNLFEQDMLQQWIMRHRPQGVALPSMVHLSLRRERDGVDSNPLLDVVDCSEDTLVAPVRVMWQPAEEVDTTGPKPWVSFMQDPRRLSSRKARRLFRKHPERVRLVAGVPGTLAELRERFEEQHHEDTTGREHFADFIARQATLALDTAERQLHGVSQKMPRHMAETLRSSKAYLDDLDALARETGSSREALLKEAAEYMDEMICAPTPFWVASFRKFMAFMLGLGYEQQVIYDPEAVLRMRSLVQQHPSMLLWTHKTYMDGPALNTVLFENDFPLPLMFTGANMGFAGLGFLVRRSAGIFIRRSFQDNELYKITLRHYIGLLMQKRFPVNWSFEGTRSRLGKLMPPRYGLLKYVLEACHATDARDIHILPISISFDLIRDVEEYATEQSGRIKPPETLKWFIGYLRSLTRPLGKVYLEVGEPVVLQCAPEPDDRMALARIAFDVAVEANRVTPITFPSLVTMALLGSAPHAMTEGELIEELNELLAYAESRKLKISPDFDRSFAQQMEGLLGLMIDEGFVTRYDQGPETVYGVAPDQHPNASYYRNMAVHFFVQKAIAELSLLKASETEEGDAVEAFWEEAGQLRDLFKFEFFYPPRETFRQEIAAELARYSENWEELLAAGPAGFFQLIDGMRPIIAHTTLLPYVEAYRVVTDLLARLEAGEALHGKDCIEQALKLGEQAYLQAHITSKASIGKILFENGFKMLENRGLTAAGAAEQGERRLAMAMELRELAQRLERLRGIAVASRGVSF